MLVETTDKYKTDFLHLHDHVQIWYVLQGTMKHIIGERKYIQKPGSCAVILPYITHTIDTRESENTPHILSLSFTDHFVNKLGHPFFSYFNEYAHFDNRQIPVFTEFSEENKETADNLAESMIEEFSKHKEMSFEKLGDHLVSLLHLLCDGSESVASAKNLTLDHTHDIANVVRFMIDHYSEKIGIDDFCKVSMMSRRRFMDNFRNITGKTAIEFLHTLRLSQAMMMLMFTDKKTLEIAKLVGLSDKSHLSRTFREKLGMSPSEYRERLRSYYTSSNDEYHKRWEWFDENNFEPYDYSAR
ncbi:MAG: helix-turn-helix domain-containing protein [Oscillospiraceae bacterium]|nr:helix-turn-helix domain-containing protein [Oscillospiraceae bacterium]